MNKLRQLIRESINEYIREIDEAGNVAALEAKMGKTKEAVELREKKMNMDGLDEAYHDMLDKGKMKELGNEVKALKKSLAKYEKQLEKLKLKGEKVTKVEDTEEEKEEIIDEVSIDENAEDSPYSVNPKDRKYLSMPGMENFDEEERYDEEGNPDENGMYDAGANYLGPKMEESMDIYEMLHMQKLAGIISETEYNAKLEEARFKKGTDIGKKGPGFEKIEKAAAKEYGSEEAGKRVAGSILKKVLKKK